MSDSLQPHEPQHARPPCPSPTPGVYPNPCPLSRWCHLSSHLILCRPHWVGDAIYPAISSSVVPFSSCPQSFPASGSFQMTQLFASGGQSIGVSSSTSVLPMNTQDWSPLGWTGWISLQPKGLSRVFSNTYDLNQIHYDFTVEVTNRFKGLDLIECLKNCGWRFMTLYRRQGSRSSPRKRNAKRQNGCLRRPYK